MKTMVGSSREHSEEATLDGPGHSKTRKRTQSESVSTYLVNPENTKCYLVLLLILSTHLLICRLGWDEVEGR